MQAVQAVKFVPPSPPSLPHPNHRQFTNQQGKGVCFRLYTEQAFSSMSLTSEPEILRCSLTSSILQLKCIDQNIEELDLMDKPEIESSKIVPFPKRRRSQNPSSSPLCAQDPLAPWRNRQRSKAYSFRPSNGFISCRTPLLPFHPRLRLLLFILINNGTRLHKRSSHNYIHPLFFFQTLPRQFFPTWNSLLRPSQI